MTLEDLYRSIMEFLPLAEIGEDNDGQLVIYTNKKLKEGDSDETVVDFDPEDD